MLKLYFYQNLSVREIGKKMECSYGTIHIKLKNIISKIQKIISTDGAYAPSVTKINYPSLSGLAANGQNNLQYDKDTNIEKDLVILWAQPSWVGFCLFSTPLAALKAI